MDDVARVVLALEAPEVTEEILHFLDRSGRARVVATAADDRQLAEAVRQLEPDAVVADPQLARDGIHASQLLAVATRESVASLRAAIRGGARRAARWRRGNPGLAACHGAPRAGDRRSWSEGRVRLYLRRDPSRAGVREA